MNMPIPIGGLTVDTSGIGCILSFGRRPHKVLLPWGAVEAFFSEEAYDEFCKQHNAKSTHSPEKSLTNVVKVNFAKKRKII